MLTTSSFLYQTVDDLAGTAMFPPIIAYEVGSLKVSNIHTIAYSLYGNPSGTVHQHNITYSLLQFCALVIYIFRKHIS